MRIVVNDIAASTGGALSILKDFYHYIKENGTDDEWIFLLGDRYIEEAAHIQVVTAPRIKKSRIRKLGFDLISGRRFIKKLRPDVVLSMQNIITFGLKVPQAVYIHQPVPFQDVRGFHFLKKQERTMAVYQHWIGKLIKLSAQKADRVIVQTRWMKKAVAEKARIPVEKIISILPDIEDLSRYKREGILQNNQFFYPTSNVIYKNNDCIKVACEILGDRGYQDFTVILTIDEEEEQDHIHFVGRLPREQVLQRYNESVLVFPSYIETFGYPLAEARQMGTVIFAADCPFSREVLEGYENAYFFNPFHPEELAGLMEQMLTGKIIKKETDAGKKDCKVSNWETLVNLLKAGV